MELSVGSVQCDVNGRVFKASFLWDESLPAAAIVQSLAAQHSFSSDSIWHSTKISNIPCGFCLMSLHSIDVKSYLFSANNIISLSYIELLS